MSHMCKTFKFYLAHSTCYLSVDHYLALMSSIQIWGFLLHMRQMALMTSITIEFIIQIRIFEHVIKGGTINNYIGGTDWSCSGIFCHTNYGPLSFTDHHYPHWFLLLRDHGSPCSLYHLFSPQHMLSGASLYLLLLRTYVPSSQLNCEDKDASYTSLRSVQINGLTKR